MMDLKMDSTPYGKKDFSVCKLFTFEKNVAITSSLYLASSMRTEKQKQNSLNLRLDYRHRTNQVRMPYQIPPYHPSE